MAKARLDREELYPDLEAAYAEMALDEDREREALEWAEASVGDIGDETW